MFIRNPDETCPYSKECSGYVGGIMCCNGNHVKCKRFELLKELDECTKNFDDLLKKGWLDDNESI